MILTVCIFPIAYCQIAYFFSPSKSFLYELSLNTNQPQLSTGSTQEDRNSCWHHGKTVDWHVKQQQNHLNWMLMTCCIHSLGRIFIKITNNLTKQDNVFPWVQGCENRNQMKTLGLMAGVERLPALHYNSVDFIFLSFGIMGFIVKLWNY